jgi:tRNA-dihydrouridine synthase A
MIHHNAITMNEKDRLSILRYDQVEHPVVIQLGGSEPSMIAESAKIAAALGYD